MLIMSGLVEYSGSESDTEGEDSVETSTERAEYNETSSAAEHLPPPATDVNTVTAGNQFENAMTDYLGLGDSSSEEEPGEYFTKGDKLWLKPITKQKKPASTTDTIGNVQIKSLSKIQDGSKLDSHSGNLQIPRSNFWMGNDKALVWENHTQTAVGIQGIKDRSLDSKETQNLSGYVPPEKRARPQEHTAKDAPLNGPRALSKSCYYMHHKILQVLHKTVQNRPPTCKFATLNGHAGAVNRLKWCRSDYSHLLASASMDTTVKIWNVFSNVSNCVQVLNYHGKAVKDVTWSPSGKEVLSCGYDRTARLCDIEKGTELTRFEHLDFLTCIKYHPVNPNYIVSGSRDKVLCWDVRCPESAMKIFTYKHNFGQVQDIAFIQDGREFMISTDMVTQDSADRTLMVYDFGSGVVLSNQVYQERYVCPRLCAHPSQKEIMAQSSGNYMCLFSTIRPYKMNKCKRFAGHKVLGYTVGCNYSPDGRFVVSGSADGKMNVWDYQRAVSLKQMGDPNQIIMDVAWHPVLNSTIASSSWGGDIDIWH